MRDYPGWLKRYHQPGPWARWRIRQWHTHLNQQPWFSLLLVEAETARLAPLEQTLRSLAAQLYPRWEVLIQGRKPPHWRSRLPVRWVAGGWNTLLQQAHGDYCTLLYPGDRLACHALSAVAGAFNAQPDAVLCYSDEDIWDDNPQQPQLKPDWNPYLFYSQNYLGAAVWYQRRAVLAVGGFQRSDAHTQQFDLRLRLTRQTRPVHLPYLLWHGTAAAPLPDPGQRAALLGTSQPTASPQRTGSLRLHYPLPATLPRVAVIILTRDRHDLLSRCISSLQQTLYPALHVCIVDNGSTDPATLAYLAQLPPVLETAHLRLTTQVLRQAVPFNYAALNNTAVAATDSELLVLLNNDIEILEPGWLLEMIQYALQAEVGVVGAKLLYPDLRVQHAGVVLGVGGVAQHRGVGLAADAPGYLGRAQAVQNLSAVTAACWVLRRAVYEELGGLDPGLAVSYNDVDFCLRARVAGYQIVWTPYAVLLHHESASRGDDVRPEHRERALREYSYLEARWGPTLHHDPAYSPNLSREQADTLACPPRILPLWKTGGSLLPDDPQTELPVFSSADPGTQQADHIPGRRHAR